MYETVTWRQTMGGAWGTTHVLSGAHRQANDPGLLHALRRIRVGEQTDADITMLNGTSVGVSDAVWRSHTQVRATNKAVDEVNNRCLAQLPSPAASYFAQDQVFVEHPRRQQYALTRLEEMAAVHKVFKIGAVVITSRFVESVPSGSQGKVTGLVPDDCVVCDFGGTEVRVRACAFDVTDNCGVKLGTRRQIPLVLGWAVTIHRCQGLTLDTLAIDFSVQHWRKEGLVYSGLSRCRSLSGLLVRGLRHELVVVSRRAIDFYNALL